MRLSVLLLAALPACSSGATKAGSATSSDSAAPGDSGAPEEACDAATWEDCAWASRAHGVLRFPASSTEPGLTLSDPSTGRELPVLVRVPEGEHGPLPVVIWSHGGGFDDAGHTRGREWGEVLAAHGLAVVHVAHVELVPDTRRTVCALGGVPDPECQAEVALFGAIARPRDVVTVIDGLDEVSAWLQAQGGPALDSATVLTAGHSAGSQAGLVLAGAVREIAPSVPRYSDPDPRPVATLGLSPQGPDHSGFFDTGTESSWDGLTRPTLLMTGDNDENPSNTDLTGPVRREAFEGLGGTDGAQHLLYSTLSVGNHGSYNLETAPAGDPELERLEAALQSTARAFADAHLRGDALAAAWLASDAPARLAGAADWESR